MATRTVTGWAGWAVFAGVMLLLGGAFQAIAGIVALTKDSFYVVGPERLLVFGINTWGWIHIIAGVLLFCAGLSVLKGHLFGRIMGVILASLAAIGNLVFVPAYPVWSLVLLTVDLLIIYALTVHGRELEA